MERPKIKYIKSLSKSTHWKDVIFYHKKSRISADFNVTDGMPYTNYLSRGDNKSFFPLWIEISISILCDNYEFGKYLSVKIQHNYHIYHIYHLKIYELSPFLVEYWILLHLYFFRLLCLECTLISLICVLKYILITIKKKTNLYRLEHAFIITISIKTREVLVRFFFLLNAGLTKMHKPSTL